ncbi:ATP-binding protein [Thalassococcus lentus]|uniref:histidine kinase n=1 Tax=Thalassococcus lentus TaxID=1210524 RepID=A0ABT4XXI9_9RHOB|nr:ATP-binding protein [Thalassococcus lentus]MDA7426692.1 ATP-binding protein [Thalassococcus lentus]
MLGYAASDNVLWVFSRGEIEAAAFETAIINESAAEVPDLDLVRLRFDILYSRIATLRESDVVRPLRDNPELAQNLQRSAQSVEQLVPWIDGNDETLIAALPQLKESATQINGAMLSMSLAAISSYADISDESRQSVALTLQMIGVVISALFLILLVMVYVLGRLLRAQEESAKALTEARDKAIEGERSKAHMLAVMSHEMRTPLNGVMGALELIDSNDLPAEQHTYIKTARNAANQLVGHVDDVLDISRLDAGHQKSRPYQFDLITMLEEVVESQQPSAKLHGNSLSLNPPHPDLHDCFGDGARIQQVLLNYIGNAIKFTRDGKITIEADCNDGLSDVEIRVTDTGIGIEQADLDRIFADFVTLDVGYDRTNVGTGLGLGIVRRLAASLGGTVGAESEVGQGSVFWLRLPLHPTVTETTQHPEKAKPRRKSLSGLKILIVEDNATNRMILRSMLLRMGHTVEDASNGLEGVEAARETLFDVILMDISMPVMDGLTATRQLRSSNRPEANVPIIATTAHALPEERDAYLKAGMRGILTKPLSAEAIQEALADALSDDDGTAEPDPTDEAMELIDAAQIRMLKQTMEPSKLAQALAAFFDEMSSFTGTAGQTDAEPDQAHRMAGSAALFGAAALAAHLRTMCESGKRNQNRMWRRQAQELHPIWADTKAAYAYTDLPEIQKIAHGQF